MRKKRIKDLTIYYNNGTLHTFLKEHGYAKTIFCDRLLVGYTLELDRFLTVCKVDLLNNKIEVIAIMKDELDNLTLEFLVKLFEKKEKFYYAEMEYNK